MTGIRSLLKLAVLQLTDPAADPEEDPMDSWEDFAIRLAFQHWMQQAGWAVPKWDQFRRIIEIGNK